MTTVAEFTAKLGLIPDEAAWEHGDQLVEHLKMGLEALGVYEAVRGFGEIISSVVELGSKLNDTAQKTGISVEGLQFYGYVAKLNSSNVDDLTGAVAKYSKGLDEARQKGEGPTADAMRRLGINFNSAGFKANSLEEQVQLVADKLAKLPDGTAKTALAMDLFGRSGANLIPTLNDLGKNGDELRKKFDALGGALTTDQAAQLDEFGDRVDTAKMALGQLKNQIVVAVLPALSEMLTSLAAWVSTHKQLIALAIEKVIHGIELAFHGLSVAVGFVANVIQFFVDHAEVARDLMIALGIVLLDLALDAAVAWLAVTGPIILVIAAVTGIVAVVRFLSKTFSEAGIGIAEVLATLSAGAAAAGVAMALGLGPVGITIAALIAAALTLAGLWDDITSKDAPQTAQSEGSGHETYEEVQARYAEMDAPLLSLGRTAGAAGGSRTDIQANTSITQHIHASEGMDSKELAALAGDHVDAAISERNRNAFDAIKGGQR